MSPDGLFTMLPWVGLIFFVNLIPAPLFSTMGKIFTKYDLHT